MGCLGILADPEDLQSLKDALETVQVKNTIKALYHERGRNVIEIAWMLEKFLNMGLHIKKGIRAGQIKSEELYKKIDEILGINSKELRDLARDDDTDYSTSFKIGIIVSILFLIGSSILFLFGPPLIN